MAIKVRLKDASQNVLHPETDWSVVLNKPSFTPFQYGSCNAKYLDFLNTCGLQVTSQFVAIPLLNETDLLSGGIMTVSFKTPGTYLGKKIYGIKVIFGGSGMAHNGFYRLEVSSSFYATTVDLSTWTQMSSAGSANIRFALANNGMIMPYLVIPMSSLSLAADQNIQSIQWDASPVLLSPTQLIVPGLALEALFSGTDHAMASDIKKGYAPFYYLLPRINSLYFVLNNFSLIKSAYRDSQTLPVLSMSKCEMDTDSTVTTPEGCIDPTKIVIKSVNEQTKYKLTEHPDYAFLLNANLTESELASIRSAIAKY